MNRRRTSLSIAFAFALGYLAPLPLARAGGGPIALGDANGNVILNNSGVATATNATNGFVYVETCAGTPTGVPGTLPTGEAPVIIDSTNNKIYFYTSGAWNTTTAAASTWASSLSAGNTSGGTSPLLSNSGSGDRLGVSGTLTSATALEYFTFSGRTFQQLSGTVPTCGDFSFTASDGGTNSSTAIQGLVVAGTFNYTAGTKTDSYEMLRIVATETSLGTGNKSLIRALAGAAGTTEEFRIDNGGDVIVNGWVSPGGTANSTDLQLTRDRAGSLSIVETGAGAGTYLGLGDERGTNGHGGVSLQQAGVIFWTTSTNPLSGTNETGIYHVSGTDNLHFGVNGSGNGTADIDYGTSSARGLVTNTAQSGNTTSGNYMTAANGNGGVLTYGCITNSITTNAGTSINLSTALPAGSVVLGCSYRITTTIVGPTGNIQLQDAGGNVYVSQATLTAGTTATGFLMTSVNNYTAANTFKLVSTATAWSSGAVRCQIWYCTVTPPTG